MNKQLIERCARAMFKSQHPDSDWPNAVRDKLYREAATAILSEIEKDHVIVPRSEQSPTVIPDALIRMHVDAKNDATNIAQAVLDAIDEAGLVIVDELELKAQYDRGYYDGRTGNK